MTLEAKIEAILFFKNEAMSIDKLADILKVDKEEILKAVLVLKTSLENRGIILLEKGPSLAPQGIEIMLGTNPELSSLIENLQKEELDKELSKASLETLSIILYKDGVSQSEIDFIRGVNSGFTLRALSIRGLIERSTSEKDARVYIYKPSFDLLSFMGITSVKELPDYFNINDLAKKVTETKF
ncbi:MAG: SMC-Scp complex subunit ScpB [Patescibacteria group bacterium]